ncbi:transcriptional regulator [Fructilactobacillus sanfranciscensis]|nr:transcriptional regulator [Fructilactobacillus sanfranciscensis]TNK99486.1 transcriptional regulator [Fructilactobacillus sanfranciscensis]
MLSLQLKELENDGIITKKIYPVVPPKTEYQVIELGISYNERNAK